MLSGFRPISQMAPLEFPQLSVIKKNIKTFFVSYRALQVTFDSVSHMHAFLIYPECITGVLIISVI